MDNTVLDHSAGEDSPNTVSESALDQARPVWVGPSEQRLTRSNQSMAEWKRAPSSTAYTEPLPRPKGGASRRALLTQIQRLEEDKAQLESRLRALMNTDSLGQPTSSRLRTEEDPVMQGSPKQQSSIPYTLDSSSSNANTAVDFPSTFAGASADGEEGEQDFWEHVVGLAGRLRIALAPGVESPDSAQEVAHSLLDRPQLREMLSKAVPHPERSEQYAHIFAKRNLELYKMPQYRSSMLQAGPLQRSVKHPRYVDILAKCLREPFIAHMGKFDEMEFCIWLVITSDFHARDGEELGDENGELDDSCYEFSDLFLKRFPFAGTKQLIDNTNVWRKQRGEEAIVQTDEMKEAEAFTNSAQVEAATNPVTEY